VSAFAPKLQALPASQRRLWPELAAAGRSFVLYGGTALSLRPAFNPLVAQKTLGFFEGAELDALDAPSRELLSRASLEDVDLAPMPRASDRLD
jgi:hypothetical protein